MSELVAPQPSADRGVPAASAPPPAVRWQSWPLRDDPLRSSIVVAALAALGAAVGWLTGRAALGGLAAAVTAAAAWRHFVPVVFELSRDGIDHWLFGRRRHVSWSAIARHEIGRDGVLLLPECSWPMAAWFGGLYVPWLHHRDEVLAQVRYHLERADDGTAAQRRPSA